MSGNDKTIFISEVGNGEFVDTSVVQSTPLEASDTKFQGKWVVSYVAIEIENRQLKANGTRVAISISWEDLKYLSTMGSVDCYEWQSDSGKNHLNVYRMNSGYYRPLECECGATVMVQDEVGIYFCCNEVASKDADFSQFLGGILNKRSAVTFNTLDNHLRIAIQQINLK